MRVRLDKALVERGLTESRERARVLIEEGKVLVGDIPALKPATQVGPNDKIALRGEDIPYVSRGGLKLEGALAEFGIDPKGLVCMDVGASTGGFTDCLLQRGAKKVFAIDVGYGQFDWKLRNDPRVVLIERMNIRHMPADMVPEPVALTVIDVSFISLRLVMPKVVELMTKPGGTVIALVKPQFEVGREDVGKGGIVRDDEKRLAALEAVKEAFRELGLGIVGDMTSPIKGQKGNIEFLLCARKEAV